MKIIELKDEQKVIEVKIEDLKDKISFHSLKLLSSSALINLKEPVRKILFF